MALRLDLLLLVGFVGLMIVAAVSDFRRLVIPNWLVLALCALWPLHIAATDTVSLATTPASIFVAAAVLASGALLFARGLIGGGDVKLLAAASLWGGPSGVMRLLLMTALCGGVLALAFLVPLGRLSGAGRRIPQPGAALVGTGSTPIPYGIAISAAALIVTIPHYFG
ncbi:MAG: prepilin peptidase [Alphaproteobacteria bacterium]|nr:prepilin peptidase [Alphaproteobacteria bacterium]